MSLQRPDHGLLGQIRLIAARSATAAPAGGADARGEGSPAVRSRLGVDGVALEVRLIEDRSLRNLGQVLRKTGPTRRILGNERIGVRRKHRSDGVSRDLPAELFPHLSLDAVRERFHFRVEALPLILVTDSLLLSIELRQEIPVIERISQGCSHQVISTRFSGLSDNQSISHGLNDLGARDGATLRAVFRRASEGYIRPSRPTISDRDTFFYPREPIRVAFSTGPTTVS